MKHPSADYNSSEFRSNMFNSSTHLQMLEFADTYILSNSNLPFLHPNETIKIWIRMRLDSENDNDIYFHISLDSENADGDRITIKTSQKKLFEEN